LALLLDIFSFSVVISGDKGDIFTVNMILAFCSCIVDKVKLSL